ncbi:MAG: flagellar hook-basal body complex protein FliE [Lachnospiraceae bacterium]|nr:flagellar hook-basal body complex protein FliE [Lachnospiraceae bacterium]
MEVNHINQLFNVTADDIKAEALKYTDPGEDTDFGQFLKSAVNQLEETNELLQRQENEEIKLALGLTDNTHDLAIAQQKASIALTYTVALRDRFLEGYKEIMQMQM